MHRTQHILRPVHIEKIVAAYLARSHEDKYSYVASIEQIRGNDFNLNIPRYVDTFEAAESIDLDAIALQLRAIAQQSMVTDVKISSFCNELGIEPPF